MSKNINCNETLWKGKKRYGRNNMFWCVGEGHIRAFIEKYLHAKGKGCLKLRERGDELLRIYCEHKNNIHSKDEKFCWRRNTKYLADCKTFNQRVSYLYRGTYGEINLYNRPYRNEKGFPSHYEKQLKQLDKIYKKVRFLQEKDIFPKALHYRDSKGRGESINIDVYGFNSKVALLQVRSWEKRYKNWWADRKIKYFIMELKKNSLECEEIVKGKNLIKKAANNTEFERDFEMPLRAVRKFLSEKWQSKISEKGVVYSKAAEEPIVKGYKAVAEIDGKYYSLWQLQQGCKWEWEVGKWEKQKVKGHKMGEHPREGLYYYDNIEKAVDVGEIFLDRREDGLIECDFEVVIFEVEAKYVDLVTGSKYVASHMRLVKIVR
jgi:hypothetical protein